MRHAGIVPRLAESFNMVSGKVYLASAALLISTIFIIALQYGSRDSSVVSLLSCPSENRTSQPTSIQEFYKYLHWPNAEACEVPIEFGGHIYRSNVFTGMDGQKTICLDQGVAPDPKKCLVYSFGINNEWSFDDRIAAYGCQVFAFDPSMKLTDHDHSKQVKFFRTGLGAHDVDKDSRGWKIRSFTTLKRELGHTNQVIDIVKIDIESAEWAVLEQMVLDGSLDQVKQLAVEIHMQEQDSVQGYIEKYWNILRGIERSGWVRFSSKGNPWMRRVIAATGIRDFFGYEIGWFNQKYKS